MDPMKSAEALLACRAEGRAMPVTEWNAKGLAPESEADAYAIQAAMEAIMEKQGARTIGYKIGATNGAARTLLGVDGPLFGLLWDSQTVASPAVVEHVPSLFKIAEPEIAVRLGRNLDPADAPFSAASIRDAVEEIAPVVEIAGTVLDPWLESGGSSLTADNGIHALWVLGESKPVWDGFDPLELPVLATRDLGEPHEGKGGAVDGGAFAATAWLANTLASHGLALRAGDYVSTGSATKPIPVMAGDKLHCDFGPLGSVDVAITG